MARIESLKDLLEWLALDLGRYDHPPLLTLVREPQVRWQVRLRCTEYLANRYGGALGAFARWRLQSHAVRLGYTIPINRFGPGLKLPHCGTIVVSGEAKIGSGCTLHVNTVMAVRDGAPTLGDGVTVAPGVIVEGGVTVGDGALLAPNAVVLQDVAAQDVVGGVPARSLHPERLGSADSV